MAAMSIFNLRNLTQFVGGTVLYEEKMTSTSEVAKNHLAQNPGTKLPLLVVCDQQTAGRGQRGKSWMSDSDSLTFTWCIDENQIPECNRSKLSVLVGISVCQQLSYSDHMCPQLKWPNDIIVSGRKVCGILVEKIVRDSSTYLIGVGINVNQEASSVRAMPMFGTRFQPGSLREFTGDVLDLPNLIVQLIRKIDSNAKDKLFEISDYPELVAFRGSSIRFRQKNGVETVGTLKGIDSDGAIRIQVGNETNTYISGSIL